MHLNRRRYTLCSGLYAKFGKRRSRFCRKQVCLKCERFFFQIISSRRAKDIGEIKISTIKYNSCSISDPPAYCIMHHPEYTYTSFFVVHSLTKAVSEKKRNNNIIVKPITAAADLPLESKREETNYFSERDVGGAER